MTRIWLMSPWGDKSLHSGRRLPFSVILQSEQRELWNRFQWSNDLLLLQKPFYMGWVWHLKSCITHHSSPGPCEWIWPTCLCTMNYCATIPSCRGYLIPNRTFINLQPFAMMWVLWNTLYHLYELLFPHSWMKVLIKLVLKTQTTSRREW